MKNNRTFKSLPTYGEIESGLFHKPAYDDIRLTKGRYLKNKLNKNV